ncbi:MAG TPA: RdgB/HAM1 family non-canonical purine NTP pyrophosphatase [Burkholderiales bacterium]|nr:RdgB/HAM1 family non-canonical purine NTP pyrophosphatase [Burkholderiales bacterium]
MKTLVLASANPGKIREFRDLLAPLGIDVVPQGDLGVPDAEEPHATFVENALAKARNAARHARLPALADDSGICVAALGGEPGVHSARFAGEPKSDRRNNEKLISLLKGRPDRRAHYYCVVVLVRHADDPEPLIAEGRWHGEVVDDHRGAGGFGYDPHFLLPDFGRTAAELAPQEKHAVSHRGKALRRLLALLREEDLPG